LRTHRTVSDDSHNTFERAYDSSSALGIIIANQRAKNNDEAPGLPHNILQKILISSSIIEAQVLLKLPLIRTIESARKRK
jgi:hypothetical protein